MSIQRTIIHECTGYYKGYKHVFEYIDDNRKVDINTTGEIICKIKKHLDFSPNTTNKKLIAYKSKWARYLNHYLVADGINPYIDEGQSYVNKNYELLKENKLLSYNEALFLLLGLNAHELGRGIKDFPVLNGDEPIAQLFELDFWRTDQNQALMQSAHFRSDGKITSENLVILATKENDFFIKPDERLKNRNIDKGTSEKLHKLLKEDDYITGEFNELWQWKADRNQLSYLAKQLKQKRILGSNCHKELANYIQDPSGASKPLKNIKDPVNTKAIDNIIDQLTE